MDDYISRQAAIETVEKCQQYKVSKEDYAVDFAEVKTELMMLPTADVVEVVRCKDCKNYKKDIPCVGGKYNGCSEWIDEGCEAPVNENDFCSYGERKNEV